jgi:hypothetical protein
MLAVLYATYLYSSPDRRPAMLPVDATTDYGKLNTSEKHEIVEEKQNSSLEDLPLEKRV